MRSHPRRSPRTLILAAGFAASLNSAAHAQTQVQWAAGVNGNWSDPTRWVGGVVPNNGVPPGSTYHALFTVGGSNYTATLDSSISLSALTVNSSFATVLLGAGSTVNLSGIALLQAGRLRLEGGTIVGGTISTAGGANRFLLTDNADNRIDGVTINGASAVFNARLRVRNGLSMAGTMTLQAAALGQGLAFENTQTFASGVINSTTPSASIDGLISIEGSSTLTIGAAATIQGRAVRIGTKQYDTTGTNALINNGTLHANAVGRAMTIESDAFTNSGSAQASAGGALSILSPAWTNTGTISAATGAILNLGAAGSTWNNAGTVTIQDGSATMLGNWSNTGSFAATNSALTFWGATTGSALSSLNITGGTTRVTGAVNNTGGTLTIAPTAGIWELQGATVTGGSLTFPPTALRTVSGNGDVLLRGVTLNNDWDHRGRQLRLHVEDSLSVNGEIITNDGGDFITITNPTSFAGNINCAGGQVQIGHGGQLNDAHLTITPTSLWRATGGEIWIQDGFTNHGTLRAQGAGRIRIEGDSATLNAGVLEAVNGGIFTIGTGTSTPWSSSGILRADGGRLRLGGNFTTAGMGAIESLNGGVISFNGRMNNTGSTFTLNATTGSWDVEDARITGGVVNLLDGSGFSMGPTSRLELHGGVVFNGSVATIAPTSNINVSGDLTLNGSITLAPGSRLMSVSSGTLHAGTINMSSTSEFYLATSALTTAPGTTVRGAGLIRADASGISTLTNHGEIRSDIAGQNLSVAPFVLTNNGTLRALAGSMYIGPETDFVNAGPIIADGAPVYIRPGFGARAYLNAGSSLTALNGGRFLLGGRLHNVNRTFNIDADVGAFGMTILSGDHTVNASGWIDGGVVNILPGGSLDLTLPPDTTNSTWPLLTGVTVNGDFGYSRNQLAIESGLTLNGTLSLGLNSTLRFLAESNGVPTPQTVSGGQIVLAPPTGARALIELHHRASVTLSPSTVIRGGTDPGDSFSYIGSNTTPANATTLINEGLISADVAGKDLTIRPDYLINRGVIESLTGTNIWIRYANWNNADGVMRANGGRIVLGGTGTDLGTLQSLNGGTFMINQGRYDNTDQTLTLTVPIKLQDGRIKGGVINMSPTAYLNFSDGTGYLENTTVNGDIPATQGGMYFSGNVAINGNVNVTGVGDAHLGLLGDAVLTAGTFNFDATSGPDSTFAADQNGQVTFNPAVTLRGGRFSIITSPTGTVINRGRIAADRAGETVTIHLARFQNDGVIEALNGGSLVFVPPPPMGGDPVLLNRGLLNATGGRMTLIGALELLPGSTLAFSVGSDDVEFPMAALTVAGSTLISGELRLALDPGFVPSLGDTFRLFSFEDSEGRFDQLSLPTLPGQLQWNMSNLYTHGEIGVSIPAPGVGAVLLGLALAARRRRGGGR